jgi:hypothetical protein
MFGLEIANDDPDLGRAVGAGQLCGADLCLEGAAVGAAQTHGHHRPAIRGGERLCAEQIVLRERAQLFARSAERARCRFVRGNDAAIQSREDHCFLEELEVVSTIVSHFGVKVLDWFPPRVPVKETLAHVVGSVLRQASQTPGDVLGAAAAHLKTATDILRVLVAWAGGNPDLTVKVPLKSHPRSLRRAVLKALEKLPTQRFASAGAFIDAFGEDDE